MREETSAHRRGALRVVGAALTLGAAVSAAFLLVTFAPQPIAERLVADDSRVAARVLTNRLLATLDGGEATLETRSVTDADQRTLEHLARFSDAYAIKLADAEGHVFASSDRSSIGQRLNALAFSSRTRPDVIEYVRRKIPAAQIAMASRLRPPADGSLRDVALVIVPVAHDGHLLGAAALYLDVTDRLAVLTRRLLLLVTMLSVAGLGVLAILLALTALRNRRHIADLKRRAEKERAILDEQMRLGRDVRLLGELNEWLQSSRSLEELYAMIGRFMTNVLPDASGSLYVYSNSRDVLVGAVSWSGGEHRDHIRPEDCWALRRGRAYAFGTSDLDIPCQHMDPADLKPSLCMPILAHGETVGLMHLRADPDRALFGEKRKFARLCAEQVSMAIANVKMRDELQDQSIRDPLTGLYNRRHLTDTLRRALDRTVASGRPVSIASVDVDHFKRFNDNHGHDAGDMVLRAVGAALKACATGDEVACRMGGEEFMLLLPGAAPEAALARAEGLRVTLEAIHIRYGSTALPRITASVGVASAPDHGTTPQDLIRAADEALYAAKAAGRNTVLLARPHDDRGPAVAAALPAAAE